jgi:queuosine precursor transporter
MSDLLKNKTFQLWTVLAAVFVASALIAEFMGVKLFSLEQTFGWKEANLSMLGNNNLTFTLTAGVLLWPIVFVMTDILNEYFGASGVKMLSWLTCVIIAFGFLMVYLAIDLPPAEFWRTAHIKPTWTDIEKQAMLAKVADYNTAYAIIFGQSLWIIVGSIFAFLIAQLVDVSVFHRLKRLTGDRYIWVRSTGSTLVSQFLDSFVVVFIALYIGQKIPFTQVLAISIMSYIYKASMAVLLTPVLYLVHRLIDGWLGKDLAEKMKNDASRASS